MISGVDLVVEQLKIAANRPLSLQQADLSFSGLAMEFRINAEDPDAGFRPDPGLISAFEPPQVKTKGVSVRWDSAIREGYRIPPHYDSMVGKLIVHGPDRQTVLSGAEQALRSMRIDGVRTTIPLHLRLLEHEGFREGRYDVNFLEHSGLVREEAE
jgi:acetyl-CoA carboxylase biotin carboxylase subunit